jgi:LysR family glycine cleavage system transcriptional activator
MTATLPLQALRTFVEVSQRGSITAAAQALHVTPGAVSQQIRLLEDRLGIALLVRERHGMRMTEAGAEAYPMLSVSTVATFAASWLVPRLGRFKERHPHIEIRVEATPALVDLRRDHVDVALRHGLGDYPGLDVVPLMAPVLVPVAAPGFAAALAEPADCLDYPLLHDADRADWPLWLSAHGVAQDARAQRGNAFDDDFLLIRAAEAGQGLALVPAAHAQEEIAAGRLVQALDKPWPARFAYYAVSRPGAVQRPEVRAFIDWIVEEARA